MQNLIGKIDLNIARQAEIELSRNSLWEYCRTLSPDYYKEDREHLKILCNTLQAFYNRELFKPDGSYYTKLILELPPQHGKSRTLTNFCSWILGHNNEERIITGSYNDDTAQDFSKYTRDIIQRISNVGEIVYSDIFPDTKIKRGDASYKQWALEGQFFNYKGCGVGGTVTGKGGTVRIIDDPVKDAEVAYNVNALNKLWLWYGGTWISRRGSAEVLDIICHTPWAKKDISGRVQDVQGDDWYILTMPVIDKNNRMLCESILNYDTYMDLKSIADEHIFAANYLMERLDIKGRLYSGFNTYSELPENTEKKINYTDTADEGSDYLCSICAEVKDLYWYVTDLIYTQDAQEVTEPSTAEMLIKNKTSLAVIESNNGGRAFARNIQRIIDDKNEHCRVSWFHQSKNKKARILTEASNVQKYILLPDDWRERWPQFYNAVMSYQKEGKNKHDDAPDTLTGLIEKTGKSSVILYV